MPLKTTRYDPVNYIETDTDARLYLEAAFETNDAAFIADAFGDVARARGMTKVDRLCAG